MNSNSETEKTNESEESKMIQRSISIDLRLWKQAKQAAGITPISAIIRRLLELWIEGKIKLD